MTTFVAVVVSILVTAVIFGGGWYLLNKKQKTNSSYDDSGWLRSIAARLAAFCGTYRPEGYIYRAEEAEALAKILAVAPAEFLWAIVNNAQATGELPQNLTGEDNLNHMFAMISQSIGDVCRQLKKMGPEALTIALAAAD